jgi:hypothetical protein
MEGKMKRTIILFVTILSVSTCAWARDDSHKKSINANKAENKVKCKGYDPKTMKIFLDKNGNCIGYWSGDPDGRGANFSPDGELMARTYPKEYTQ